jgi:hypothetical protein
MGSTSVRAQQWRARIADWWANMWRWALIAAGAALAVYFVLERGTGNSILTASALALLAIGAVLTSSKPLAIALMATPALFIVQRIGLGGGDLSVSDVALAAALGTAVLLGQRPYSRPMRALLWLNLLYQFGTLFTVIVNPYTENTFEWFHAWLLISGALIVGWALGRGGYAKYALSAMVVAGCVIAAGTLLTGVFAYASGNFGPVYPAVPWSMHKNAAGTLMSFAALIVYVNPGWANLPVRWTRLALALLLIAIVMTQSRQAWVGLVIAVIVVVARRGGHSRLALLLVIPAIWLVVSMVLEQIESQNQHNSLFQRLDWLREVYAFWKHSPIFGHGLRFWYVDPTVPYQPPQAEIEVAASAGVVGLAAFIIMWIGILIVLYRVDPVYGTLALAAVLSRIVQAQFDLFWVTAQVSVPFVIAGICLGAQALSQSTGNRDAEAEQFSPPALAGRAP